MFNKLFFRSKNKFFIRPSKVKKMVNKKNFFIIDTRTKTEFKELAFKNSYSMNESQVLKEFVLGSSEKVFVLVGKGLRNNVPLYRELTKRGYKNVYLIDRKIDQWPFREMLRKKATN